MGAAVYAWVLVMTSLCGMSHAFFSNYRPPSCFPQPRHDSCRETIEDLKSLLEIVHTLKPDTTIACPACTPALSEELIVKLVNALIYTTTQNCGFSGKGCSGIPPANHAGVGRNTEVKGGGGDAIGGSNIIISNGGGTTGGNIEGNNTGGNIEGSNTGGNMGGSNTEGNSGIIGIGGYPGGFGEGNNIIGNDGGVIGGSGNNGGIVANNGVLGNVLGDVSDAVGGLTSGLLEGNNHQGSSINSIGNGGVIPKGNGNNDGTGANNGVLGNALGDVSNAVGGLTSGLLGGNNHIGSSSNSIGDGRGIPIGNGNSVGTGANNGILVNALGDVSHTVGGLTSGLLGGNNHQGSSINSIGNGGVIPKGNGNNDGTGANNGVLGNALGDVSHTVGGLTSGLLGGNNHIGSSSNIIGEGRGIPIGNGNSVGTGANNGVLGNALGDVSNAVGGLTSGLLGGNHQGNAAGNFPSTSAVPTSTNIGVANNPGTGVLSAVNNGAVSTGTVTNQNTQILPQGTGTAGVLPYIVPSQGTNLSSHPGAVTAPVTGGTIPVTNVNSGNAISDQTTSNVINVVNPPISS